MTVDPYAWLASLKAGDVAVHERHLSDPRLVEVERVTPTQIVVGPYRFRRKDGSEVGNNSWSRAAIYEPTQARRDECERCALVETIRSTVARFSKRTASLPMLRAVAAALRPPTD